MFPTITFAHCCLNPRYAKKHSQIFTSKLIHYTLNLKFFSNKLFEELWYLTEQKMVPSLRQTHYTDFPKSRTK